MTRAAASFATWRRPQPHRKRHPGLLSTVCALLRVVVVGLFILTFIAQPFRIPSGSMEPTLDIGDFVLVSKTDYDPHAPSATVWGRIEAALLPPAVLARGDLVVFHFPPDPAQHLVKRVVGLPGERLRLHNGRVFVNGKPLVESYAMYTPAEPDVFRDEFPNLRQADPSVDPHWWLALRQLSVTGEITVPANEYFVLGDNRNNSEDSRYWGFVPRNMVVGRPLLVYFAVPNGADSPEGGPLDRLRWLMGWVHKRVGVPR